MPRRLFKRYMPDPASIREHKSLRFFGKLLHDPNLWHLNRHSVARAMGVGLFAALIPIPMQMLLAVALAIPVRGNLPIAVSLVWLTNPLTMPPVFFVTYMTGAWLMQLPPRTLPDELTSSGSPTSWQRCGSRSCWARWYAGWCWVSSPTSPPCCTGAGGLAGSGAGASRRLQARMPRPLTSRRTHST